MHAPPDDHEIPHWPTWICLDGSDVREVAKLRLRLRRWQTMMDPHHAQADADGCEIPASAWHAYSDEAEAIADTVARLLLPAR